LLIAFDFFARAAHLNKTAQKTAGSMSTMSPHFEQVSIKRAYDPAAPGDGYRVLVDRLWPRGIRKEALPLDEWNKQVAPSTQLRQWFGHDPERWTEFQKRYRRELSDAEHETAMRSMLKSAGHRGLTLIYAAKDLEHNHALVLQAVLRELSSPA
jgi:uncharacterized protein YeaO (DUF488 family)